MEYVSQKNILFKNINDRGNWSEDFEISLNMDHVYLVFHNGTKLNRQMVLNYINDFFNNAGINLQLEEI